jgi:hypothetical protein
MFKAEDKNALLKIPHLDQVSENFVSHLVFGDKFGEIAFPGENFVGTFGVCECESETCLDWPPDEVIYARIFFALSPYGEIISNGQADCCSL